MRAIVISLVLLLGACANTENTTRPTSPAGWIYKYWGFTPILHPAPEAMPSAYRGWVAKYFASAHNCGPAFVERVRQSLEDFGAICRVRWIRDGTAATAYDSYFWVAHKDVEGWSWQRLLEYQIKYRAMSSQQIIKRFEPLPIRVPPTPAIEHHFYGKMILETGEERPVSVVVFKKRGEFQGVVSSTGFLGMKFAEQVQAMHEYLIATQ
jgi:hypothetical protein